MECTAVRCVRRIRQKVAAAPLSKTAAAAAAAKAWFVKHPLDYMLHNRFPWKRSGRRSSMWPPYSLWRNLSAAACRPCDRSLKHIILWLHRSENVMMAEFPSMTTRGSCSHDNFRCCQWLKLHPNENISVQYKDIFPLHIPKIKLTNVSQRVCYIHKIVYQNVGTSALLSSEPKKSSSLLCFCWVRSSRSFTPCVCNRSASSALTILHFSLFTSNLGKLDLSVIFSFTRMDVFTTRLAFKHPPQITLPRRERSALAKRAGALPVPALCYRPVNCVRLSQQLRYHVR